MATAQRVLYHQHRATYDRQKKKEKNRTKHMRLLASRLRVQCVAPDLQVVFAVKMPIGQHHTKQQQHKSFRRPCELFFDASDAIMYVEAHGMLHNGDVYYVMLLELCGKVFGASEV